MLAYLYCAAYTRMTMNESLPPCEQSRITFNDDEQRVQRVRPRVTSATLHFHIQAATNYIPHHRLGMITPRLIAGIDLPTPKGWIVWLAKADCTHITFAQGYYTIESKGTKRK